MQTLEGLQKDESPTTETQQTETQETETTPSFAELLNDVDPPPERAEPSTETDTGKAAEKPSNAKPLKALSDLAERLEVKPESLYAIEIPMSDGTTMPLGKLKDAAAAARDLETDRFKFEESRSQRESDLLRAQSELQELVAALPKTALKPEILEVLRTRHENTLKRERSRTLEAIPEWQDETRREQDVSGMVEWLKSYGFPENYLASVYDHRAVRFIRDNWQRAMRVQKAMEQLERQRSRTPSKGSAQGKSPAPNKSNGKAKPSNTESKYAALLDQ